MPKLSNLGVLTLLASSVFACTVVRTHSVTSGCYCPGWVHHGTTNERLGDGDDDGYTLNATYGKTSRTASKNEETGKFWVGPIEPFHDYTINIEAGDNYRPFYASQAFLGGAA